MSSFQLPCREKLAQKRENKWIIMDFCLWVLSHCVNLSPPGSPSLSRLRWVLQAVWRAPTLPHDSVIVYLFFIFILQFNYITFGCGLSRLIPFGWIYCYASISLRTTHLVRCSWRKAPDNTGYPAFSVPTSRSGSMLCRTLPKTWTCDLQLLKLRLLTSTHNLHR